VPCFDVRFDGANTLAQIEYINWIHHEISINGSVYSVFNIYTSYNQNYYKIQHLFFDSIVISSVDDKASFLKYTLSHSMLRCTL